MFTEWARTCTCTMYVIVQLWKYINTLVYSCLQLSNKFMYMYMCIYVRTNVYRCMHQLVLLYTCLYMYLHVHMYMYMYFDLVFQICVSGLKGRRPRLPTTVCGLNSVCHAQTSTGQASPPTRSCTHTSVSTNSQRRMVSLSSRRFSNNSRVFPRQGPSFL